MRWSAVLSISCFSVGALAQGSAGGSQASCSASTPFTSLGCYNGTTTGVAAGFTWMLVSTNTSYRYYPGYVAGSMTIDFCLTACRGHGMRYAALSFGSSCYCAPNLPNYGASSTGVSTGGPGPAPAAYFDEPTTPCETPCTGNRTQYCGGSHGASVYQDTSFSGITEARSASNYNYVGCFSRIPPGTTEAMYRTIKTVSSTSCATYCGQLGYTYFSRSGPDSLTANNTCGCGSEIQKGYQLAESACDINCDGSVGA